MNISYLFMKDNKWNDSFSVEDSENLLILLVGKKDEATFHLYDFYKKAKIIGTSTCSKIFDNKLSENSLLAVFLEFKTNKFFIEQELIGSYEDSFLAGEKLTKKILSKNKDVNNILFFVDGLSVNGSKLALGMSNKLLKKINIAGGSSAPDDLGESYVYFSNKSLKKSVVAVAFHAEGIKFKLGNSSGMMPIGIERKITKAKNNIIYEIEGRKALDYYREWLNLDKNSKGDLLKCPIEISENFEKAEGLVRTPFDFNEEEGSITFTGEVSEGLFVRFLRANITGMIDSSCNMIKEKSFKTEKNVFNFLISCMARKFFLGTEVEDEFFEENKNERRHQFGFYSYGEFTDVNDRLSFLNQTMTMVSIMEE